MSNDLSHSLSEPGSGIIVLPQPDKAVTNGWRRETPPFDKPPWIVIPPGTDEERIEATTTGVEL